MEYQPEDRSDEVDDRVTVRCLRRGRSLHAGGSPRGFSHEGRGRGDRRGRGRGPERMIIVYLDTAALILHNDVSAGAVMDVVVLQRDVAAREARPAFEIPVSRGIVGLLEAVLAVPYLITLVYAVLSAVVDPYADAAAYFGLAADLIVPDDEVVVIEARPQGAGTEQRVVLDDAVMAVVYLERVIVSPAILSSMSMPSTWLKPIASWSSAWPGPL